MVNMYNRVILNAGSYFSLVEESFELIMIILTGWSFCLVNTPGVLKFIVYTFLLAIIVFHLCAIANNTNNRRLRSVSLCRYMSVVLTAAIIVISLIRPGYISGMNICLISSIILTLFSLLTFLNHHSLPYLPVVFQKIPFKASFVVLLRTLLHLGGGFFLCQLIQVLIIHTPNWDEIIKDISKVAFPLSNGFTENVNWLTIGIGFFTSSLIIIRWFRDCPCSEWNPYTVQELRITENVISISVLLLGGLVYSVGSGLRRTSFMMVISLLTVNIYALYLQNRLGLDHLIRRKIIQKMDVIALANSIDHQPSVGIMHWEKDFDNYDFRLITERMTRFAQMVSQVAQAICTSGQRTVTKAENYIRFVETIYQSIARAEENSFCTIAFICGYLAIPGRISKSEEMDFITNYVHMLGSMANQLHLNRDFLEMMTYGLNTALIRFPETDGIGNKNPAISDAWSHLRGCMEREKNVRHFIAWILERQNGTPSIHYSGWTWMDQLDMQIKTELYRSKKNETE